MTDVQVAGRHLMMCQVWGRLHFAQVAFICVEPLCMDGLSCDVCLYNKQLQARRSGSKLCPGQDPVGNKLFTLFIICLVLHLIEL